MSIVHRRNVLKFMAAAPLLPMAGHAQTAWPTHPIKVILGFAPGGAGDVACRLVFEEVSSLLKQQVVIENRSGGASLAAAQAVASAPKDGHTFFFNGSQQITAPALINLPLDYKAEFVPVTQICKYPQVFAVGAHSPVKTLADVVEYAKANPGKMRCGTSAAGNMAHLAMAEFERRADIKFVWVPYRSAAEAPRDLVSGQLDVLILAIPSLTPMMQANRVRLIATTSPERIKTLPDVMTVAEQDFAGFQMDDWGSIYAPTGTSKEVIDAFQAAIAEALKGEEMSRKLLAVGAEPVGSTPEEFAAFLSRQEEAIVGLIKEANIKLE